jgi:hypothetical protein
MMAFGYGRGFCRTRVATGFMTRLIFRWRRERGRPDVTQDSGTFVVSFGAYRSMHAFQFDFRQLPAGFSTCLGPRIKAGRGIAVDLRRVTGYFSRISANAIAFTGQIDKSIPELECRQQ